MSLAVDRLSPHDVLRKIQNEMLALKEAHPDKLLVAQEVVDAASDPQSAMHGEFTWDDTEAAKERRLDQARMLIRKVRISNPADLNKSPIPCFVSLMQDRGREGGGYRHTAEVLANDGLVKELEATFKKELQAFVKRYSVLEDLVASVLGAAGIETPEPEQSAQPRTRQRRQGRAAG